MYEVVRISNERMKLTYVGDGVGGVFKIIPVLLKERERLIDLSTEGSTYPLTGLVEGLVNAT